MTRETAFWLLLCTRAPIHFCYFKKAKILGNTHTKGDNNSQNAVSRVTCHTGKLSREGTAMKKITFGVDEKGNILGEAHHNAKLSDADVELIRDIYEEGLAGYATLARVFGVKKATIYDIVNFRRRATTPAAYRTVEADKRKPLPKDRLDQLLAEDTYDNGYCVSEEWDEGC